MRLLYLLASITGFADQTEWVRRLETGGERDPDICLHTSRGMIIARGAHGMSRDAWSEVSTTPWINAHHRDESRRACAAYLELTYIRLRAKLKRPLSFADVYAGYRYGVTGYVRMGGKISSTPPNFREKIRNYVVPYQRVTDIY